MIGLFDQDKFYIHIYPSHLLAPKLQETTFRITTLPARKLHIYELYAKKLLRATFSILLLFGGQTKAIEGRVICEKKRLEKTRLLFAIYGEMVLHRRASSHFYNPCKIKHRLPAVFDEASNFEQQTNLKLRHQRNA